MKKKKKKIVKMRKRVRTSESGVETKFAKLLKIESKFPNFSALNILYYCILVRLVYIYPYR